jgi:hypothetical protein
MNFPTFVVQWVDPNDTTLGMDFFPPKGSDELHEALKQYYPHLNNLQARMRQASIDFLLDQDQASPASEKPTPNYLPSPSSFPSSAVASPSDAMLSAAQNSTLPKQEDLMNVWTLPSNPDAKIHKRRTMTAEEKRAYKQKRLEGACADCKRRRRKCQHGTSPAASSSSSSKPPRRKARSKPSLDVSPSPSDVIFPAGSMDQCVLPEPQPFHDVTFSLFGELPTTLGLADGTLPLPEMDFDPTFFNTDDLDLNKDWELFPDTQHDISAPFQPIHAVDTRQYSALNTDTPGHPSYYFDSPGGLDSWTPSLDYQSRLQPRDQAYPTMSLSPSEPLNNQPPGSSGSFPTPSFGYLPDSFHGPDILMETSPSSSSQGSFSDTGHVPGGSCASPSTSASSGMLTDWSDIYPTVNANSVPGPLFKQDLNLRVSGLSRRLKSSRQLESPLPLQDLQSMDGSIGLPRCPQFNALVAGSLTQRTARPQTTSHDSTASASPLCDTPAIDGHAVGIPRSKKPEQIDRRDCVGSKFYDLASAFVDADRHRERALDVERHRIQSALNEALQIGSSTTSSTKAMSTGSNTRGPDRTKDETTFSFTITDLLNPSSPMSSPRVFISRETSQCESTTGALAYVSEPESVSSPTVVGGAGYWNNACVYKGGSLCRTSSSVTSTRDASPLDAARGILHAPRSTAVLSALAVGGADHSLFKPGHHSLVDHNKALLGVHSERQHVGQKTLSTRIESSPLPSLTTFSTVISTTNAQQYHLVNGHTVFASAPEYVSSAEAIGVVAYSRNSFESPGASMRGEASSSSRLAGQQAQICLGMVYFFAVLRATPRGKKMSGSFLAAVLGAALFVLSLYGFVLR